MTAHSAKVAAQRDVADALLNGWLSVQRERIGIAGLAAGIILSDETTLTVAHGFADAEKRIPMTVDTPMRVASITKIFTVTALLMARDRGLLALDAPAQSLVPELSSISSPALAPAPITLRQLVSHTAGLPKDLPYGVQYWDRAEHDVVFPSAEEARAFLRELRLICPPMTTFHYSNIGFMLVGLAVEAAFGIPYEAVVRDRILAPLGMADSFFWSRSNALRLARGYRQAGTNFAVAPNMDVGWDTAGGGLCCSANDLARFLRLHLTDHPAGGAQVLGGSSIREAQQPVFLMDDWDQGVGLGWWLRRFDGATVATHSGNIAGFDSCVALVPALGLGAFILTNTNAFFQLEQLFESLLKSIMAASGSWMGAEQADRRAQQPLGRTQITGRYDTCELTYDVVEVGGRSAIVAMGDMQRVAWLEPTTEDGKFIGGKGFALGEPVVFAEPRNGRFTQLTLQGMKLRRG